MAAGCRGDGPGIVVRGKLGAALDCGVVVGPEDNECAGVRVFEPGLAEMLECGDGGLLRVGDDAVDRFLAVDIGLMFDGAADGVADGFGDDFKQDEREQYDDHAGQRRERFDAPTAAAPAQQRRRKPHREPEQGERSGDAQGDAPGEVMEDVVAALVGKDKEDFVLRHAVGGGVPDDDALGGSDAADVGVEAVAFDAGLHEEHALWRDLGAGARDDALELSDKLGVSGGEWREVIEERLDDLGQDKRCGKDDGDGGEPEPEPGAPRRAREQPACENENRHADDEQQQRGDGLVAQPAGPALNADADAEQSVLQQRVSGQQDAAVEQQQERGGEERGLRPRSARFDAAGEALDESTFQQQDEQEDDAKLDAEVEREAQQGEMMSQRGLRRGKRVHRRG